MIKTSDWIFMIFLFEFHYSVSSIMMHFYQWLDICFHVLYFWEIKPSYDITQYG